jgi:hypothetical protein
MPADVIMEFTFLFIFVSPLNDDELNRISYLSTRYSMFHIIPEIKTFIDGQNFRISIHGEP